MWRVGGWSPTFSPQMFPVRPLFWFTVPDRPLSARPRRSATRVWGTDGQGRTGHATDSDLQTPDSRRQGIGTVQVPGRKSVLGGSESGHDILGGLQTDTEGWVGPGPGRQVVGDNVPVPGTGESWRIEVHPSGPSVPSGLRLFGPSRDVD